jgi:adenylosuccinate synthase
MGTQNQNGGYADVLLGLQYGDEGKARVVDFIAPNYDIIARFNGGANAGHTIETKAGGKVALNQVPSAIFYEDKILYIGSGCATNPVKLKKEIENIKALGVKLENRLHISCQVSVVQPHHMYLDGVFGGAIGSTKNGIGPCYADKANRMLGEKLVNIRTGDLLEDLPKFIEIIKTNLQDTIENFGLDVANVQAVIEEYKEACEYISAYIQPDTLFMQKKVEAGAKVLFEGAQSVMLDVTKGSVPYVTSSTTIAPGAYSGGDLSPNFHRKTIGIAKAIMSRVGHGPFASEFGRERSEEYCMQSEGDGPRYGKAVEEKYDTESLIKSEDEFEMGKALRVLSFEYGTVSTRPRRIGAFDMVQLNYAIRMNGVTELVINKCDLLKEYTRTKEGKMPLVVSYDLKGQEIDYVPGSVSTYYKVMPITKKLEMSSEDISGIRNFEELSSEMQNFKREVEAITECKVVGLGVGPEREQFIQIT